MRQPIPGSFDAETLARTLAASGLAWCWLDGEASPDGEQPVSYFGVTEHVFESDPGGERDFLERLRAPHVVSAHHMNDACDADGVGFHSGWVAALSYEFGVSLEGVQPAHDSEASAFALRLDAVLALTGDALELRAASHAHLEAWREHHEHLLDSLRGVAPGSHPGSTLTSASALAAGTASWRRSRAQYENDVVAAKRAIARGDAYVLCLTDTATIEGRFDPVDVYARLRRSGTAIRGGIIAAGDRALVSASPERFLAVRGREISTRPIKGTRPRSADPDRDRELATELAADAKERAENLMIVDLMRNDLSRVCEPGSVRVRGFLHVEHHPHVHQLVSTVVGQLRAGVGVTDAITACFPGGSMTGAPKRRAVELLAVLEHEPRGLYSGCFGWIDDRGDTELAMTIRGVELRGLGGERPLALVGAGGGVTADSDPESERAEKDLKAASILAALRAGPA